MATASTVAATSWVRTIRAPFSTAMTAAATPAACLSAAGRPVRLPRVRCTNCRDVCKPGQYLEIVPVVLAESEARVDDDARCVDAGRLAPAHPLGEKIHDLPGQPAVVRLFLHRFGRALHVHQADRRVARGNGDERAVAAQCVDIIDKLCPGRDGSTHDEHRRRR